MKITRASDYAVRMLTHLAKEKESTSGELARRLDIPLSHLVKLVQMLGRRGYLLTRRGKRGGLKLGLNPKNINLREVIEAIEGPFILSDCLFHPANCRFSGRCKARKCFATVRSKIQSVFSSTTIFDLVSDN